VREGQNVTVSVLPVEFFALLQLLNESIALSARIERVEFPVLDVFVDPFELGEGHCFLVGVPIPVNLVPPTAIL
jgi:hypothetical protein